MEQSLAFIGHDGGICGEVNWGHAWAGEIGRTGPARENPGGLCDDEEVVRDILERMLTALGFRVIAAGTGEQALAVLEESPADIIICDLRMPGFGGPGLYEAVTSRDPELGKRMIFCTGDTVSRDAREFLRRTGCRVVCKPFDLNRIEQTIAELQYEMAHGSVAAEGGNR